MKVSLDPCESKQRAPVIRATGKPGMPGVLVPVPLDKRMLWSIGAIYATWTFSFLTGQVRKNV